MLRAPRPCPGRRRPPHEVSLEGLGAPRLPVKKQMETRAPGGSAAHLGPQCHAGRARAAGSGQLWWNTRVGKSGACPLTLATQNPQSCHTAELTGTVSLRTDGGPSPRAGKGPAHHAQEAGAQAGPGHCGSKRPLFRGLSGKMERARLPHDPRGGHNTVL